MWEFVLESGVECGGCVCVGGGHNNVGEDLDVGWLGLLVD